MSLALLVPTLALTLTQWTHDGRAAAAPEMTARTGAVSATPAMRGAVVRRAPAAGESLALTSTDADASCVMQGGVDIGTVTPLTTDEDVATFYSYGVPDPASYNGSFPTVSGDSMILIHRDSTTGVRSLVIVHDRPNDGSGGQMHMELAGLGTAASVAVEDDPGEGLTTGLDGLGDASFDWRWMPCCTDGVAIADIDWDAGCVSVELGVHAGIDTWSFVDGETLERIPLDPSAPLQICPGECNACPTAVVGPPQTVECGGGGGTSVTFDGSASSDPEDDPLTYDWSIDAGAQTASGAVVTVPLGLGDHDATLEVSDGLCEDADATTATVQDTLAPSVDACPPRRTLVLGAATCTVSLDGIASATDACEGAMSATHRFDFAAPGSQTYTYVFTDTSGNASSCSQSVSAVDLAPPVPTCPPDETIVLSPDACEASTMGEATGIDACDGAVSESHPFAFDSPGSQTWTYVLADASGNTSTCTQTVTAIDVTPPVYTPGPTVSIWAPNHKYVTATLAECGAAVDACDGPLDLDGGDAAITSLASSEPDEVGAGGDGHTTDDAVILDGHTFAVRGERQGGGEGRAYSVGLDVFDRSANALGAECALVVEHDQGQSP